MLIETHVDETKAMPEEPIDQKKIKKQLNEINHKLDQLLTLQTRIASRGLPTPNTLSSLPEHLRKTAIAITTLGQATAEQVATKTRRTRAAESDYLNQLTDRGILKKERIGREVEFRASALYTTCPQCAARVLVTLNRCAMCGRPLQIE